MDKQLILHLTLINDIGPAIIRRIMQSLQSDVSMSQVYGFSRSDWMYLCGFTDSTAQKIVVGLANKKSLEDELRLIAENNVSWATVEDDTYPSLLREIYLPPTVLYWQSQQELNTEHKALAIVGSRKADAYGQFIINQLIPDLVAAHYSIISGGASGLDTMAHETTLKYRGKTIAVLGSGLLQPYPRNNRRLFEFIVEHAGAIVSSFPLRAQPLPGNFPARNRIITGLSHGCLVVQAAQKSGALISAHYAIEQGKEVFAVPGRIGDELSAGCNTLIQSGAKLVINSADILSEFGDHIVVVNQDFDRKNFQEQKAEEQSLPLNSDNEIKNIQIEYAHYSASQKKIIFACEKWSSLDEIAVKTQLSLDTVQVELFNLQLDGVVSQNFIGMWIAQNIFTE